MVILKFFCYEECASSAVNLKINRIPQLLGTSNFRHFRHLKLSVGEFKGIFYDLYSGIVFG